MSTAYIFDSETTGFVEPEIIEAAGQIISFGCKVLETHDQRFRPSKPIEWGAVGIHHILEEDLLNCDPSHTFRLPDCDYLIGHNIDFDWEAAGSPPVKRICTLALSRALWPDTDSHKLASMVYMLHGRRFRNEIQNAHSALVDVALNLVLLKDIFAALASEGRLMQNWEYLWEFSEEARIPVKMTFGKHYGEKIKDLPYGYRKWLLGLNDLDPYLEVAIRRV